MSVVNLAMLNAVGVDVVCTTSSGSTAVALPYGAALIMVKNVGSNEAFIRGGVASVTVSSASAASGMSIPAGAIEVFRANNGLKMTHVAALTGTSTTTLRVYPVDGK